MNASALPASGLSQSVPRKASEKRKRLRIKLAGKLRGQTWLGNYIIARSGPSRGGFNQLHYPHDWTAIEKEMLKKALWENGNAASFRRRNHIPFFLNNNRYMNRNESS